MNTYGDNRRGERDAIAERLKRESEDLQQKTQQLARKAHSDRIRLQQLRWELPDLQSRIAWAYARLKIRRIDEDFDLWPWFLITFVPLFLAAVVGCTMHAAGAGLPVVLLSAAIVAMSSMALLVWVLFIPPTDELCERLQQNQNTLEDRLCEFNEIARRLTHDERSIRSLATKAAHAQGELDRIRYEMSLEYQRAKHLARDWTSLRGTRFEKWVKKAFELQGYDVESTVATGDQGVDLIVRMNGWNLAVQVKGRKNKVGSREVRESFAGMLYYRCQGFVFVTNNEYTGQARDYAIKVGCQLIDQNTMERFVRGELRFHKATVESQAAKPKPR